MRSAFLKKLASTTLVAAAMVVLTASSALASHFRYGTINWSQAPANPRQVTFIVTTAWRRTWNIAGEAWGLGHLPNVGDHISGTTIQEQFCYGDGSCQPLDMVVTSVDPTQDYFVAVFQATHLYSSSAAFKPYLEQCCRLTNLANESFGIASGFNIWTTVDTRVINHPPTAAVPPIVNMALGFPAANFQISATDIDGDHLTYRLATTPSAPPAYAEFCGPDNLLSGNCSISQPPLLTVDANGLVRFPTNQAGMSAGQLFATQIVITDNKSASNVVDLLIKLVNPGSTHAPLTLINGSAAPANVSVRPNTPVILTVQGTDVDLGDAVTLSVSGAPVGSTMSPLLPTTGASPQTSTFSWTPTLANAGFSYNVNFITTDNVGLQDFDSASIQVLTNLRPTVSCPVDPLVVPANSGGTADVTISVPVGDVDGDPLQVTWNLGATPLDSTIIPAPADVSLGTHATALLHHLLGIGSYGTQIVVSDGITAAVSCSLTVQVTKAPQTIVFDTIPAQTYGGVLTLAAVASSGLPITYNVASGPATVAGDQLTLTGVGSVTVEASQGGNGIYDPAVSVIQTFSVGRANPDMHVTHDTFTYDGSAHAAGGWATGVGGVFLDQALVTITYDDGSNPPTTTAPTSPGLYTVVVSFGGDANYNAGTTTGTHLINQAIPTMSVTGGTFPYDGNPHLATATVTGGLGAPPSGSFAFTYKRDGFDSTPVDVGTYAVQAQYSGDANYLGAKGSGTIEITARLLTVTANNASRSYGESNPTFDGTLDGAIVTDNISATYTSPADPSSPPSTYPIMPVLSDPLGRLSNYDVVIHRGTLTVGKASQTITFPAIPDQVWGAGPLTLGATASSHLPITYAVNNGVGVATVSGDQLTLTGIGLVTIEARQAGDGFYEAADPVFVTFHVAKASQTITFPAIPDQVWGAAPLTLDATASSHLPITYAVYNGVGVATVSGDQLTLTGIGLVTIEARQAGDGFYEAADPVFVTFHVAKASQAITFPAIPDQVWGAAPLTLDATASSHLPITYAVYNGVGVATVSGDQLTLTGIGLVTIEARQAGDGFYEAADPVFVTFHVAKASQAITFPAIPDQVWGAGPLTLGATASSHLPVRYYVYSGAATVVGDQLTLMGAGPVIVDAFQDGDGYYEPALSVRRTFDVGKANAHVTVNGFTDVYDGHAHGATGSAVGVNSEDLSNLLHLGSSFTNVPGGTAHWTFDGNANYVAASGDVGITLTKATLTVTADNKSKTAGDANPPLTASYSGFVSGEALGTSGVTGAPSISTTALTGSPAGTYPITADVGTLAAGNYSFTFVPGTLTVTASADGRMFGNGFIDDGSRHHHFEFRVTQQNNRDSGRFEYWVRTGRKHDDDDDDHDGDRDDDYGRNHGSVVNRFEATAVTSVVFSDDPAFRPGGNRNQATVDTVVFTGTGKWNGKAGYTFEVRAADHGEPGRNRDVFFVVIRNGAGAVVGTINDTIDGGNIQSTRLPGRRP